MAHTCPRCQQYCHCRGDIDDINFGERWDCICCQDYDDSGEDDDYYNYDDEGLTTIPPIKPTT